MGSHATFNCTVKASKNSVLWKVADMESKTIEAYPAVLVSNSNPNKETFTLEILASSVSMNGTTVQCEEWQRKTRRYFYSAMAMMIVDPVENEIQGLIIFMAYNI